MSQSIRFTAVLLCLLGWVALASPTAGAQSLSDLQQRFKQRYPKLMAAKNAGTIGETHAGWVEVVKPPAQSDVQSLVDAENADRKKLYAIIAEKEGTTPQHVAERNAIRNFEKADSGHWLKTADGVWKKKK